MSDKLDKFIKENFNNETVKLQIEAQNAVIKRAEVEIERLKLIEEEQSNKKWYFWDGINFVQNSYNHDDGYRSSNAGTYNTNKYEEFIYSVLSNTDKELDSFGLPADSDFFIVSPVNNTYRLNKDDFKDMPLILEYYERKILNKQLEVSLEDCQSLEYDIDAIENNCQKTDMYTPLYIANLRERQSKLKEQLKEQHSLLENEETFISIKNRIEELNLLLVNIDRSIGE
jgi:hypothetical protein